MFISGDVTFRRHISARILYSAAIYIYNYKSLSEGAGFLPVLTTRSGTDGGGALGREYSLSGARAASLTPPEEPGT